MKYLDTIVLRSTMLLIIVVILYSTTCNASFFSFLVNRKFDKAMAEMADHYSKCNVLSKKRIAIRFFRNNTNQIDPLGMYIAESLQNELTNLSNNADNFVIVERSRISDVDDEVLNFRQNFKVNIWGKDKKKESPQAADYMIIGSYECLNDKTIKISSRMISISDYAPVSAKTIEVNDTKFLKSKRNQGLEKQEPPGTLSLKREQQEDSRLEVKLFKITNNNKKTFDANDIKHYSAGKDKMSLSVYLKEAAYLYIFAQDTKGNAAFLFPTAKLKSKRFEGGRIYFFPEDINRQLDDEILSYSIQPPTGKAILTIIASTTDIQIYSSIEHEENSYVLDHIELNTLTEKLNELPQNSWWQKQIEFWIE